eukprot:Nitzschia sp. Nitz4//scaffold106_size73319//26794//28158//NITZ4_005733-RA/size73319-augustus-gene-0.1-mRNA-1//1//CDS//3329532511//4036//frame0
MAKRRRPHSGGPKKRPREEDTNDTDDEISPPKVRNKKKSKKNKQPQPQPQPSSSPEPTSSSTTEPLHLEGMMFQDQMVLLDRATSKVYAGLERTEAGDYIQIGILCKGKIQLKDAGESTASTATAATAATASQDASSLDFPFETDPDDHCESPKEAYQNVVPFLQSIGSRGSHIPASKLKIYDPYFCNGAVVRNLQELGFPNVYNQKEDCYEIWKTPSRYPAYDVFVTNPPYSADHIEALMRHVTSPAFGQRPWMLLMPQWVHKKDYYINATSHIRPFFLIPKKRYVYVPPPDFREAKKSDVHKKSSPFVSMWFVWGGTQSQNDQWLQRAKQIQTCEVARSKAALRDLRRKGNKK